MKIKELFRNAEYPIKLYDESVRRFYRIIIKNRDPKVEITMDQISEKFGIPINQLKIKKE